MDINDGRPESSPSTAVFSSPPPPPPRHIKQKRAPSITPRKFNAFFARRSTRLAPNGASVDQSSRALGAITGSAINRRQRQIKDAPIPLKSLRTRNNADSIQDENENETDNDNETPRQAKRRKTGHCTPPDSSPVKPPPPLFQPSSPCARDADHASVRSALLSPLQSLATSSQMTEDISDFECDHDDFDDDHDPEPPKRLRQLTHRGMGAQLFQRQLGDMPRPGRSYMSTPTSDWRSETAAFSSGPTDAHFCSSHEGLARCIPFCTASCNTNSLVAVGDEEGRVRLLDTSSKARFDRIHLCFQVHGNAIIDMDFSEDDRRLATASGDQSGKVIDMMTQTQLSVLGQHTASLKQVRFQPGQSQGNVIATSGRDGSIQIWDLRCNGGMTIVDPINLEREVGLRFTCMQKISTGCVVNSFFGAHEAMPRHQTRSVGLLAPTTTSTDHQPDIASRGEVPGRIGEVSVTALQWMPSGREHLLLSACEADASIKLWDIRSIHTSRNHRAPTPLSYTATPASHVSWRHFGISSLSLSTNGSRLYALCKDNTVYAYSTSHMVLGPPPGTAPAKRPKHAPADESPGPLYGFRHPSFHATSFYVKSALRPMRDGRSELLAVGSADNNPILFPTDERYFKYELEAARLGNHNSSDVTMTSTSFSRPATASGRPGLSRTNSFAARPGAAGVGGPGGKDDTPIIRTVNGRPLGTPLVRGHEREVGSLAWTAEGNLVSVGDDFMVRCWSHGDSSSGSGDARGETDEERGSEVPPRRSARELRTLGEGEGRRWGSGWADVGNDWDADEADDDEW